MNVTLYLIDIVVPDIAKALIFNRERGWDIPAALDNDGHVEHVLPKGLRVA